MPRRGRNSSHGPAGLYTPELAQKLLAALDGAVSIETAAALVGISKQTLYNWLKAGARGEDPVLAKFREDVYRSVASVENKAVGLLWKAMESGDSKAIMFFLERGFHRNWGKQDRIAVVQEVREEVRGELDSFLTLMQKKLSPEVYASVLAVAAEIDTGDVVGDGEAASPDADEVH